MFLWETTLSGFCKATQSPHYCHGYVTWHAFQSDGRPLWKSLGLPRLLCSDREGVGEVWFNHKRLNTILTCHLGLHYEIIVNTTEPMWCSCTVWGKHGILCPVPGLKSHPATYQLHFKLFHFNTSSFPCIKGE